MSNIMNLVKMSIINFKSIRKTSLIVIACFTMVSIFNSSFAIMLMGMLTYLISYQTMVYEDSYGIDNLIAHLPVTKKQYILSRYVFSVICMVISALIFSIITLISMKLNMPDYLNFDYKSSLAIGILMSITLSSILIPILLYLGIKKARIAMIVVFMIVVMVPTILVGDNTVFMDIMGKIDNIDASLLSVILSVLFLVISYGVTTVLYNRKQIV